MMRSGNMIESLRQGRQKMNKRYLNAVAALYGDEAPERHPSTKISRSSRHGQISKPRRYVEAGLQMKYVAWLFEIGIRPIMIGNEGKRTRIGHHRAKLMGMWTGASDLFLPVCRNGYGGYWIELKRPGETPRANQVEFLDAMRRQGYRAEWFDNLEAVQQSTLEYLNGRI